MTGPEHYKAAENLIASVNRTLSTDGSTPLFPAKTRMRLLVEAQVHATLALAAAHAMGIGDLPSPGWDAWREAAQTRDQEGRIVD